MVESFFAARPDLTVATWVTLTGAFVIEWTLLRGSYALGCRPMLS